jgi:hypothetical protein
VSLAEDAHPTLSETLAWMDSTYNPHQDTGGAWGHGVREIHDIKGNPFLAAFYMDDDRNYAGRFAKAFLHAIAQCGGKPSVF